ncbi:hypothetical protein SAMN03159341_10499 [Paenibacillus sp. 1_12]|uniref:transmembrane-type terpene cyclase n=1 Tax=Paenibacillus sp. 1_12 TaxID=1566278 RepID=UPI0008E58FAC|nr:hypothetical protein [Paenibacillus sp. 1_12]SFL22293.1 hypothetical protein SAMN03159341_10499 [Paenibacillus sp. 1_12]
MQQTQHLFSLRVELLLLLGMAFFWTITYLLVIYKGFRDRTCGMPMAAICANITWEFLFSFILPFNPLQQIITVIWFFLDCIILLQFFYYSKRQNPTWPAKTVVISLIVIALLLHYGVAMEFHDLEGKYSAFGINLMMSILFIRMLMTQDLRGQSKYIAYFKMIGTLCISVLSYSQYPHSILLTMMYIFIFIIDVVYILLITNQSIKIINRINKPIEKHLFTAI